MEEKPTKKLAEVQARFTAEEGGVLTITFDPTALFADIWPNSITKIIGRIDLLPGTAAPGGLFIQDKSDQFNIVVTEMYIKHTQNSLIVRYSREVDLEKHTVSQNPDIILLGLFKATNSEIQQVFPLLRALRTGNVARSKNKYTKDEMQKIVREWHDTDLYGNEAQDTFAREYEVTGRTLRNWIMRFPQR